jgi:hypothetical protein
MRAERLKKLMLPFCRHRSSLAVAGLAGPYDERLAPGAYPQFLCNDLPDQSIKS